MSGSARKRTACDRRQEDQEDEQVPMWMRRLLETLSKAPTLHLVTYIGYLTWLISQLLDVVGNRVEAEDEQPRRPKARPPMPHFPSPPASRGTVARHMSWTEEDSIDRSHNERIALHELQTALYRARANVRDGPAEDAETSDWQS